MMKVRIVRLQQCVNDSPKHFDWGRGILSYVSSPRIILEAEVEEFNDIPDSGDVVCISRDTQDVPGYSALRQILDSAYDQASAGKGKDRHANGEAFTDQLLFDLIDQHGVGFATGQAAKKLAESHGLDNEHAVHEILGAIVYAAAAAIWRSHGKS